MAVRITVHHATTADVEELVPLLRAEDRAEVLALGRDPTEALHSSRDASAEAFTWRVDGQIMAMGGVVPETAVGPSAVPWMLGTALVGKHRRFFVRESHRMIDRWMGEWSVLTNVVDVRYAASVRWLQRLGFTMQGPVEQGHGLFWVARKERPAC